MKFLALLCLAAASLHAGDRPNILWITSEDNDVQWLGCYGNEQAQTPNLDKLATQSARFTHFYSNAPVCAVARSTILNGVYAPSQGTQHMRSRHAIPSHIKPYVSYLREAGYYCTNASKTDYNFEGNDRALWDDCSAKAHYKNRPEGKPFFAIFNLNDSHESSLFDNKIEANRKSGLIPQQPRIDPAEVIVPPYLPDLPEIRSDIAIYHDNITMLDRKIGKILSDLTDAGLAENTLIFYYSDHGGILPRGKRYLTNTGVNVPLIVHIPARWKALSPFDGGSVVTETTAFVDLAPTVLSLIGQEKPDYMQGRAFLGESRVDPPAQNEAFLFADRFDDLYGMRRGLTDGRWKYIRRFTPQFAAAPYSYYQFGQAGWQGWQAAWKAGSLPENFSQIWEMNQVVEELYDTESDRWEIKNLANDPTHQKQLLAMRERLAARMVSILDTGLIPEPMFAELSPDKPIATYAKEHASNWPKLVDLALKASARDAANLPVFIAKLSSEHALERYWASQGCLILGKQAGSAKDGLTILLEDPFTANRTSAAYALILLGETEAAYATLLKDLSESQNPYALQNVINAFTRLDALDRISDEWVKNTLSRKKVGPYVRRMAEILAEERDIAFKTPAQPKEKKKK